jgi:D-alanyl-D-alanine dipeptidase
MTLASANNMTEIITVNFPRRSSKFGTQFSELSTISQGDNQRVQTTNNVLKMSERLLLNSIGDRSPGFSK